MIALYLDNKMYSDSLALVATLLKELKKLDDKMVLVEVQLLESRVCHALHNLPKAKVSSVILSHLRDQLSLNEQDFES